MNGVNRGRIDGERNAMVYSPNSAKKMNIEEISRLEVFKYNIALGARAALAARARTHAALKWGPPSGASRWGHAKNCNWKKVTKPPRPGPKSKMPKASLAPWRR